MALLFTAAETHVDWEIIADEDGKPRAVRSRRPAQSACAVVRGEFPERAEEILSGKARALHLGGVGFSG